jgi:hypothetical protein
MFLLSETLLRLPALVAPRAPAAVRPATADRSRRTVCTKTATRRLIDRRRVLDLGMKAARARCYRLCIGWNSHGPQHERRCRPGHREFLHQSLPLLAQRHNAPLFSRFRIVARPADAAKHIMPAGLVFGRGHALRRRCPGKAHREKVRPQALPARPKGAYSASWQKSGKSSLRPSAWAAADLRSKNIFLWQ